MKQAIKLCLAVRILCVTMGCSVAEHDSSTPKSTSPSISSTTLPGSSSGTASVAVSACTSGTATTCGIASCGKGSMLSNDALPTCQCIATSPGSGSNSCEVPQSEQLNALKTAMAGASAAARETALKSQSLTIETLKSQEILDSEDATPSEASKYCRVVEGWPADKACPPLDGNPKSLSEGTSYSFKDGSTTYTLVAGRRFGGCGRSNDFEFARKSGGAIVIVEDQPKTQVSTRHVFCGCAPYSGCGGAEHRDSQHVYLLPEGATFGGKVTVAYTYEAAEITYDALNHASPETVGEACGNEAPP